MPNIHIILVHGAYHQPWHLFMLRDILEDFGYTVTTPRLPCATSHGPPASGMGADVEVIKDAIETAVQVADGVVMVFHSYGGIPGNEAVAEVSDEAKKKIIRLIHLAAFVIDKDTALTTPSGGKTAPWSQRDGDLVRVLDPLNTFYHDVEPGLAAESISRIVPHAYVAFTTKTKHAGWRLFPCTYVICSKDRALPVDRIRGKLTTIINDPDLDKKWDIFELESGHSPFLNLPSECAKIIRKAAGEDIPLDHIVAKGMQRDERTYDVNGYLAQREDI